MPTYEYLCQACEHDFELYQSFSADPIKVCPECGEEKVQKVISGGGGVVFKGGGFYETDYKRGKGSEYTKKSEAEVSPKATCESGGCQATSPKECPVAAASS